MRVFISHASEDTDRFVKVFGTRLRERAIDAWIDFWEIQDGDSLVQRIFEEGIGKADAILVVISKYSVHKPWVQKEWNVAVVRQIEEGTRLIPIVLNDQQVPVALRDTKYRRIKDPKRYDTELEELVMSLYNYSDKPALGVIPPYARRRATPINSLTDLDSQVLKFAGDLTIEANDPRIDSQELFQRAAEIGIPRDSAIHTLEVLLEDRLLTETPVMSGSRRTFVNLQLSMRGFETYLETYYAGYDRVFDQVKRCIVSEGMRTSVEIAQAIDHPRIIVDHVFNVLAAEDQLRFRPYHEIAGGSVIFHVSAKLSRE